MIKSYESCRMCFFGAMNRHCSNSSCADCIMYNGGEDTYHEEVLCKCNTIEPGAECPWYHEEE